jgi:hypothetical protein
MRDTIDQFMWGFQPHFRSSLESDAKRALEEIGVALRPGVVLVGFLVEGGDRHPEGSWPV